MSTVNLAKANINQTETRSKRLIVALLLLSTLIGAAGCEGYYSAYPGYGPYYGGPYYGRPYYGGYPGSVTIAVGDRPYYVRGPGYWAGGAYYVWRPGHWAHRYGQNVWVHGHYVVRGY
jgi:WXXGXW repeat (2 copies)